MVVAAFSKPLWDPATEGGPEMEAEMSEKSFLRRLGEAHEIAVTTLLWLCENCG